MNFMPWISIAILIYTGYLLIKRSQTHMTLLLSGLAMLLLAISFGVTNFLPKGVKPSGFVVFDIFDLLRSIGTKQVSGIGFLIMAAGGFAAYMDTIGAAKALVDFCIKPLRRFSQPYLILVLGYLIGTALVIVIPSAAGLAMLLLVALFPILVGVGVSPATAAAVIGTTACIGFAPAAGTANLAAKTAGVEPVIYLVHYQLPVALCVIASVAIAHYFIQKYYDKKNDDVYSQTQTIEALEESRAPKWYAIFPILPVILMIIFSKLVYAKIQLNTVSALLLVWVLVVLIELIRFRDAKKVFKEAMQFFKKMGGMFASIVALIICAGFFAAGLKATGVVALLIQSANGLGLGMGGMTTVLTVIVGAVTFLTGSGVGAFSSFAALAPDVAASFGGDPAAIVSPMQIASGIFRAMSPVAGVVIAVAGAVGITPMALVRRTTVPMLVAFVVTMIANWLFFIV